MTFNRSTYAHAKKHWDDTIEKLWPEAGFMRDGVIAPDRFAREPLKILCVLAEPYGYEREDTPDVAQLDPSHPKHDDNILGFNDPQVKSSRKIAALLCPLLRSASDGQLISEAAWREMPLYFTVDEAAETRPMLQRAAWINVKKCFNPKTQMDAGEVIAHARRNHEVLAEQIAAISPDLILLACGNSVAAFLIDELELFGPVVRSGQKRVLQKTSSGSLLVELGHPASRTGEWSYAGVHQTYREIWGQMRASDPSS